MPTDMQIKMAKLRAMRKPKGKGKPKAKAKPKVKGKGPAKRRKANPKQVISVGGCNCPYYGEGPKLQAIGSVLKTGAKAIVKGAKLVQKHRKEIASGIKEVAGVAASLTGNKKVFGTIGDIAGVLGSGQKGKGTGPRINTGEMVSPYVSYPNSSSGFVGVLTF